MKTHVFKLSIVIFEVCKFCSASTSEYILTTKYLFVKVTVNRKADTYVFQGRDRYNFTTNKVRNYILFKKNCIITSLNLPLKFAHSMLVVVFETLNQNSISLPARKVSNILVKHGKYCRFDTTNEFLPKYFLSYI